MRYVAASYVNRRFGEILDEALAGKTFIVTRHGAPKAVIVPYREYLRITGEDDNKTENTEREESSDE